MTAGAAGPCRVLHSSQFRRAADFAGQRVLVVGLGEAGSDLSLAIAKAGAAHVTISTRANGPGAVVGRWATADEPADLQTSRANMAEAWGPTEYHWLWKSVLQSAKGSPREAELVRTALGAARQPPTFDELERDAMAWNHRHRNLPFSRFGTKNFAFLEAIRYHGAAQVGEVRQLLPDGQLMLADGTRCAFDAVICCTGYESSFPFFERHMPDLARAAGDARTRFKHMLCPAFGATLAFVGFARPAFGAVPPMSELAARYWAALLAGELTLPSHAAMIDAIARDRAAETRFFERDAGRLTALCQYRTYLDDLAALLGCLPRLPLLRANHASVWHRVKRSALCAAQFRLHGPGASEEAWLSMARMPLPRARRQPRCAVAAKVKALAEFDEDEDGARAHAWLWSNHPPPPIAASSRAQAAAPSPEKATVAERATERAAQHARWLEPIAVACDAPVDELAAAIEQSGGVLRLVGAGVGAPYEATGALFDGVIARHAQLGLGVSSEAGRLERGLSWKGRWPWLSQPGQNADQKRVLDYAFGHSELGAHEALPPALAALAAEPLAFLDAVMHGRLSTLHEALARVTRCAALRTEAHSLKYRLSDYMAHGGAPCGAEAPRPLRCAEHRDYGTMALIFDGGVPGLEVLRDGAWYLVKPSADDAILMLGWATHIRSNGRVYAPTHRVRDVGAELREDTATPSAGAIPRRLSLVAFSSPPPQARLAPEGLREGETAHFRASVAGSAHAQALRAHKMI